MFTLSSPEAILATPANSQTRWADVAPIDPETGQVFNTPGEAHKSGKYAPFDARIKDTQLREDRENYQRREAKRRKMAPQRAWKRMQAGELPPPRPAESTDVDSWIGEEPSNGD